MSGYTEIIKTLRELRDFLHQKLNDDFMNSIQGAANSIQRLLADPNLPANLNAVLAQLQELLKNANKEDLVGKMAGLITQAQDLLKLIDPKAIEAFNNLLKEAEKGELIKNIIKALESIGSMKDLIAVAKDLALPAKVFLYGATGAIIGIAIVSTLDSRLKQKNDDKLLQAINKLVLNSAMQTIVQITALQVHSADYLLQLNRLRYLHPDYILSETDKIYQDKCRRIANDLVFSDEDNLELIKIANDFCGKMVHLLYQEELDKESISDYLDRVNHNMTHWENLVEFTSYASTVLSKKGKPELLREDLNYYQIKKLYGDKQINAIMKSLVKELSQNGGHSLFLSITNSFENGSYLLAECFKQIPDKNADMSDDMPWNMHVQTLHTYFHGEAEQFVSAEWKNTKWVNLPEGKEIMPERVSFIIRMRALVELCHQTAPYLCFPFNAPREVLNGVLDIPYGGYQLIRHPFRSVYNLARTFSTLDGWASLANGVYSHPLRFLTSTAVSAGMTNGINTLTHSTSAASHITSTAFRATKNASTLSATTTSAVVNGAGASVGALPVALNENQNGRQVESNEIELTANFDELVPKMIPDAYPLLMERLVYVKNIDELYDVYARWYAEVTISSEPNDVMRTSMVSNVGFFARSDTRDSSLNESEELQSTLLSAQGK